MVWGGAGRRRQLTESMAVLLLCSQHALGLIPSVVGLSQGALLKPVAFLGHSDGRERLPPRRRLVGSANLTTVNTGALGIFNKS